MEYRSESMFPDNQEKWAFFYDSLDQRRMANDLVCLYECQTTKINSLTISTINFFTTKVLTMRVLSKRFCGTKRTNFRCQTYL